MKKYTKTVRPSDETLPASVWEHINIEVDRVASRFNLSEEDRADLFDDIYERVRDGVVHKYSPERSSLSTYVQRQVKWRLGDWMRRETRRRDDLCALARNADEAPGEEAACDESGMERLATVAMVRMAVSRLAGTSRQICALYLRCDTLGKVFETMRRRRRRRGLSSKTFYCVLWPKAKDEFRKVWQTVDELTAIRSVCE